MARVLVASSRNQAFLDRTSIAWLLRVTPVHYRAALARRMLSLSPHYFIYQWSDRYEGRSRGEALQAEYARNAASRRQIFDMLIRPHLRSDMRVLDFGCGPGFLAREASQWVSRVIAVDVSRGVVAAASALNPTPNIEYLVNRGSDLGAIADGQIDLVYSIAVIQHLDGATAQAVFNEFARVLRPTGRGLCHFMLEEGEPRGERSGGVSIPWYARGIDMRVVRFTRSDMLGMVSAAGFRDVRIVPVGELAVIDDDVGREHMVVFRS